MSKPSTIPVLLLAFLWGTMATAFAQTSDGSADPPASARNIVPHPAPGTDRAESTAVKKDSILFLGNSITRHGPAESIGWTGNWGMAASAEDKDYAHLVVQALSEPAANGGAVPAFRAVNVADFERQYAEYPVEKNLLEYIDFAPDLLILAIGENVPALHSEQSETQFYNSVVSLLKAFQKKGNPTIVVRSCFWPCPKKDAALKRAASAVGAIFVDISGLAKDEANYARSERRFSHAGVAAHPGDRGMKAIADAIVDAVRATETPREGTK